MSRRRSTLIAAWVVIAAGWLAVVAVSLAGGDHSDAWGYGLLGAAVVAAGVDRARSGTTTNDSNASGADERGRPR